MSDNTKIEWTDATWNPITGCSVVSAGCTNCYAMRLAGTRLRDHPSREGLTNDSKAGPVWNGQVRLNEQWLDQPMRWLKPRRIFVCAHGDLFHENVPDEWIDRVFAVMALSPHHTFQVLTKRPERMREYMTRAAPSRMIDLAITSRRLGATLLTCDDVRRATWHLPNVWLGVSVESQAMADERIPLLLDTPAAIRWISAEPLLGLVDLTSLCDGFMFIDATRGVWLHDDDEDSISAFEKPKLDWVVAGGESGPGARPMHPNWARALRDQCSAAGVPFHFKQWGEYLHGTLFDDAGVDPGEDLGSSRFTAMEYENGRWNDVGKPIWADFADGYVDEDQTVYRVGKKIAGRYLDGTLHDAYPETPDAQRERLLGEMARVDAEYLDLKYL